MLVHLKAISLIRKNRIAVGGMDEEPEEQYLDPSYEFSAPHFYDFDRQVTTSADQADAWFDTEDTAGIYSAV